MKNILPCLLATFLLSLSAPAQTPEETAKTYFELLQKQQWTEIAELYDPAALSDFREMMSFLQELPDELAGNVLGQFFSPGTTKEQVKAMSDADFFSSFLGSIMKQAASMGRLNFDKLDVIGSVDEGEDLRHVVTRNKISLGELSIEEMEIISFRKTSEGWKIVLQGKMKGMAAQLKAALSQAR